MSALSPEIEAELRSRHEDYYPNQETCRDIGSLMLVTVSAPSGMGKNSVMRATGIHTVFGFTSRPRRQEEINRPGYDFLPDVPATYDRILEDVRMGELVQFGVGMDNYVYGSYPDEYIPTDDSGLAILDNSSKGAIRMRPLPFNTITNTYLTAPFDQWVERFNRSRVQRMKDETRTRARIEEAYHSLGVALEDGGFKFIENLDGQLAVASQAILSIASGHDVTVRSARIQAEQLRKDIKDRLL